MNSARAYRNIRFASVAMEQALLVQARAFIVSAVDHSYLVTLLLLWSTMSSYPSTTLVVLAGAEDEVLCLAAGSMSSWTSSEWGHGDFRVQELGNCNVARVDPTEQELGNYDAARVDSTEQELRNCDVARVDPTEQELGNYDFRLFAKGESGRESWDLIEWVDSGANPRVWPRG
ncbi:hypothetical protein B296_00037241 [Ensete ventricosum]|uniref:Uncharacterized protein n=1 Tax=Ensete ventricosum TaxID=4639 RepID=A0A426YP23_ENSVE|nr:hypothetical protein B296_00037241 [Ensete ventricosum]